MQIKNKTYILGLVVLLAFTMTGQLMAQQTPVFSQYYLNPYLINPAAAGADGYTNAFLGYRKQWVDIPGAPETQVFSVEGSLKNENIGLGVIMYNDVTNIIGRFNFLSTLSYSFLLDDDQQLRFGLSLGFIQNKVFFDKIFSQDPNGAEDPALLDEVDNRSALDGNFGISYRYNHFTIGIASHQLFQNTIRHEDIPRFRNLNYTLIRHYIGQVSYDFDVKKDYRITPGLVIRTAEGLSSEIDYYTVFRYRELGWLSVAYRNKIGLNLGLGFEVNQKFGFGYSYEIPTSTIKNFTRGSHEVSIKFRFGKGSPNDINGQKNVETLQRKLRNIEKRNEKRDQAIEKAHKSIEQNNDAMNSDRAEIRRLQQYLEQYKNEFKKIRDEDGYQLDIGYESDIDTAHWDYYVILGTFKEIGSAKKYQQIMMRNGEVQTIVIQNGDRSVYFVTPGVIESRRKAYETMKHITNGGAKAYLNQKPWVYKKKKVD